MWRLPVATRNAARARAHRILHLHYRGHHAYTLVPTTLTPADNKSLTHPWLLHCCRVICCTSHRRYQHALDKTVVHIAARWAAFAGVTLLYALRVYYLNGWFIVTYGLGIYLLNLFIGFITPQVNYVPSSGWMGKELAFSLGLQSATASLHAAATTADVITASSRLTLMPTVGLCCP